MVSYPSKLSLPEDYACEEVIQLADFLREEPDVFDMMLAVGPQAAAEILPILK